MLLLCLGACSNDGGDGAEAEPSPSASFPFATVLLDNGERSTLVTVEVAETAEQQERGLSERASLPEDEGMVFVFFEERDTGLSFGSAVPLSIAFFDATGEIVEIVEAEECPDETCSTAPYMGALAVNEGSFEEWDISAGDHLQLTR